MPNQRGADWQTKTAHGGAEPTSGVLEIQCVRMQIPAETHKREVSLLTWPRRPVAPKPPPDADAPGGGEVPKNDRQQGAALSGSQKTPGQKRKKINEKVKTCLTTHAERQGSAPPPKKPVGNRRTAMEPEDSAD